MLLSIVQIGSNYIYGFDSSYSYFNVYTILFLFKTFFFFHMIEINKNLLHDVRDSYGNNRLLALWRRPVLVKGPLGIVSVTELAFSAMFMALLIWSFSTYLYTGFSNIQLEKEGEQV